MGLEGVQTGSRGVRKRYIGVQIGCDRGSDRVKHGHQVEGKTVSKIGDNLQTGKQASLVGMQVEGITLEVMRQALDQAKAGRQHILREMQSCDPPPAKQLSQYAPRIRRFNIDPDKIGQVIGSGGRNIKMLQAAAGCDEIMVSVYLNA